MTGRSGAVRALGAPVVLRRGEGWTIRALRWLPVGLAVVAEGAWITIVAGLVQEFALRVPVIGLGAMVALVAAGAVIAHEAGRRAPGAWPLIALALVIVASIGGWLASPETRAALGSGDLAAGLALNPGGLAAGLAVLRGFAHGGDHVAVETVARMVFAGLLGLGLLAAIGGMIVDPWRSQFLADAAIGAVVFCGSGLLALAFAGFADVERGTATGWRRNPTWIGLLCIAVAALVATAIPIAVFAGPTIVLTLELVLGIALVPFAIAGLLYRAGAGLRRLLVMSAFGILFVWILSLISGDATPERSGAAAGGAAGESAATIDRVGIVALGVLVTILLALGIVILARAWVRRRGRDLDPDQGDERSFELPEPSNLGLARRRGRRSRSGTPASAAEAYRHLIADLEARPDARRRAGETPAEHARRLRLSGAANRADGTALQLALLAADYGLEQYGRTALSGAETRRAIDRWRLLRRRIGRGGRPVVDRPTGPPDREADVPGLPMRTGPGPISATDDEFD